MFGFPYSSFVISPGKRINNTVALQYSLLITYIRSTCWKDPTSKFFQARRAHIPSYSEHRIQQSLQYADLVGTEQRIQRNRTDPPRLCIGVPSVRRDNISYLKSTLGSLQDGLTAEERASLYFVVLLAHSDQKRHPDYGQPWLANMADKLPSYDDDPGQLALAKAMELSYSHGAKSKFDYLIVMQECEKTDAPYILIIEDDVVFLDGWRHRAMQALDVASTKSWEAGHTDCKFVGTLARWCRGMWRGVAHCVNSSLLAPLLLRGSPWLERGILADIPWFVPRRRSQRPMLPTLNPAIHTGGAPVPNRPRFCLDHTCLHASPHSSLLRCRGQLRPAAACWRASDAQECMLRTRARVPPHDRD